MTATIPTMTVFTGVGGWINVWLNENLVVHMDTLNTGLTKRGIGYQHLLLAVVFKKGWLSPYFYHLVHRRTWLG